MTLVSQILSKNKLVLSSKHFCIPTFCTQFSSSAPKQNLRSINSRPNVRQFSTRPRIELNENNIDHLAQRGDVESSAIKRSISLKFPDNISLRTNTGQQTVTKEAELPEDDVPQSSQKLSEREQLLKNLSQPFVFIRDLSLAVDLKESDKERKNVALRIPNSKQLVEITFDFEDGTLDNTSPSKAIGSVTERLWKEVALDYKKLPQYYMKLSKARLTGLVVITTMAGYAVAPDPFHLGTFLLCTLGTALTSSSANAVNQYLEIPYDSQMNRTKNRVLVRGHLTPLHAATFAAVTGSLGLAILTIGVNPLTATLGAFNLGLYTMVYTPMKRYSIANTWVGSVVGAIPPMMGWTACTGMLEPGALLLGAIMYAWQFPHFNSLSWNLRPDYSRGGYRMASVVRPQLCKVVALRYSAGMIALCAAAPFADLTTWTFVADSLPLNVYMTYLAWNFYRKGDSNSSRKLFRFTLVYIPALMVLMFVSKKGTRENQYQTLLEKFSSDSVT